MLKLENNINIENVKIKLKYTEKIEDIKHLSYEILKNSYNFKNTDVFLKILTNEYHYITLQYYSLIVRKYIKNYNSGKEITKSKHNNLKIINNNLYIGNYIILPITKGHGTRGILTPLYYYFYDIRDSLPYKKDVCIIQTIGPWEILHNTLNLYFELEDMLITYKNCNVSCIFLLIDYGENVEYKNIKINSKIQNVIKDFIIININNINEFDNIDNFLEKKKISEFIVLDISYNEFCYNELMTLPLNIYLYKKLLNNLSNGGNIYMYNKKMEIYIPKIQFLNLLFLMFSEIIFYNNIFTENHLGFYKFSKYNNINYLNDIYRETINNDKYLGQHLNFNNTNNHNILFCDDMDKTKSPKTYKIIKSIINYDNYKFIEFITSVYNYKNNLIYEVLKKINVIEQSDYININTILSNNVSKSIEYCKKNNIEINDIYSDFKILNYNKIINKFFPKTKHINNIQLSADSCYSITLPEDTLKIIKYIKKEFSSVDYIIDGTANVGSSTIIMAEYFYFIYSFEINEDTCDKLKNNVDVYNIKNVDVINYDITKMMYDKDKLQVIKYDPEHFCLFLDPPWEGVFYKIYTNRFKIG